MYVEPTPSLRLRSRTAGEGLVQRSEKPGQQARRLHTWTRRKRGGLDAARFDRGALQRNAGGRKEPRDGTESGVKSQADTA